MMESAYIPALESAVDHPSGTKDKQEYRRSHTGCQDANNYLEKLTERVQQRYRQLRGDGLPVTNELLLEVIKPTLALAPVQTVVELSMVQQFEAFMETMRGMGYAKNTLFHSVARALTSMTRSTALVIR